MTIPGKIGIVLLLIFTWSFLFYRAVQSSNKKEEIDSHEIRVYKERLKICHNSLNELEDDVFNAANEQENLYKHCKESKGIWTITLDEVNGIFSYSCQLKLK